MPLLVYTREHTGFPKAWSRSIPLTPTSFKPTNYNLSIDSIRFAPEWTYQGKVSISGALASQAKQITLNSHQLQIHSASISSEAGKSVGSLTTTQVSYSEADQRATLSFDQDFPASEHAELTVTFQGTINNVMAGFYRSKYKPAVEPSPSVPKDDGHHYMFSTQFESCDARRAFPCFDEPNLKASFEFAIEIPEDQTALSNMPEKEVAASQRTDGGKWKVVSFEKSPVMSTYLFAWAFGDFEYVEAETARRYNGKKLPVRVYTTKGLKEDARWALENAWKIIDLFSEVWIECVLEICGIRLTRSRRRSRLTIRCPSRTSWRCTSL
jgi:aminopeptidase N